MRFLGGSVALVALVACGRAPDQPSAEAGTTPPIEYSDRFSALRSALEREIVAASRASESVSVDPETMDLALAVISDPRSKIGRVARTSLAQVPAKASAAFCELLLDRARPASERAAAAMCLSDFPPTARPLAALGNAIVEDREEEVRSACAFAAGKLGDRRLIPSLLWRLKDEGTDRGAAYLAFGLAKLGCLGGIEALREVVRRETVPDAVALASEILAREGILAAGSEVAALLAALDALGARWRAEGISRSDAGSPTPEARLAFLTSAELLNHPNLRKVDEARYVLSKSGRAALEPLEAALFERDPYTRVRAMEVLGWLGPLAAPLVPRLLELAGDPKHRAEPLRALGRIGDERAAPALALALQSKNAEIRAAAARGLASAPFPGAIPSLMSTVEGIDLRAPATDLDLALGCGEALALVGEVRGARLLVDLYGRESELEPEALDRAVARAFAALKARGAEEGGVASANDAASRKAAARAWAGLKK
ncbi:MAG: HEAT repeat domain-containing protein [Planctomycetes bacterium]|nr:HEAT repeat domain-containing protein [Planctomycetota bacterium]